MGDSLSLYNILHSYAKKVKSPSFPLVEFVNFLAKYANRYQKKYPNLVQWMENTERRVSDALPALTSDGSILLEHSEKGRNIVIPQYCVESINNAWKKNEESPELPFPDEGSLGYKIPHKLLKVLSIDLDFPHLLKNPQTTELPIIKLVFPEGYGSLIVLAASIPRKILEFSLLKVRHYLRSHNNRDYLQSKLTPAFPTKETQLKSMLTMLTHRPFDGIDEIERAGEFSFLVWSYMISMIKSDIRKKNELNAEDYAVIQAIHLTENINNWYKSTVQKKKEVELAIKNLGLAFDRPPFAFSLKDILGFRDSKGIPLLGQYSQEDLDGWLAKYTHTEDIDHLPQIITLHNQFNELVYIKSNKLLPLTARLINEARPRIKNAISKSWYASIKKFQKEAAMDNDAAFNRALSKQLAADLPLLNIILENRLLYLAYIELEEKQGIPESSKIFKNGSLIPMNELLLLQRKKLLTDVRMLLPFWYSMPIISGIITFISSLRRGNKKKAVARSPKKRQEVKATKIDIRQGLQAQAKKLEGQLVPAGRTIEETMDEYLEIWNRSLNKTARDNLTEDVQTLTREYLRKSIRHIRAENFTLERVKDLAFTLCQGPHLQKIGNTDALQGYLELYILQTIPVI